MDDFKISYELSPLTVTFDLGANAYILSVFWKGSTGPIAPAYF